MSGSLLSNAQAPLALSARDVHCAYGDSVAVEDATLDVDAGASVAIVGESGSGKTTLLRCFNRMVAPQRGVVTVGGADVSGQPVEALRRRIGYVPQQGGLLPHWRVLRNVALVPALRGYSSPETAAAEALTLVGLSVERFGGRFPHQLSGGQRQRVALARALAAQPGAILLDEPFGALDAITRSEVLEVFIALRSRIAITTLFVTHDLAEAARLADEIIVMHEGRIEQRGTLAVLRSSPATAYVEVLVRRAVEAAASLVTA